jgi:hypothetical protein
MSLTKLYWGSLVKIVTKKDMGNHGVKVEGSAGNCFAVLWWLESIHSLKAASCLEVKLHICLLPLKGGICKNEH